MHAIVWLNLLLIFSLTIGGASADECGNIVGQLQSVSEQIEAADKEVDLVHQASRKGERCEEERAANRNETRLLEARLILRQRAEEICGSRLSGGVSSERLRQKIQETQDEAAEAYDGCIRRKEANAKKAALEKAAKEAAAAKEKAEKEAAAKAAAAKAAAAIPVPALTGSVTIVETPPKEKCELGDPRLCQMRDTPAPKWTRPSTITGQKFGDKPPRSGPDKPNSITAK